MFKKIILACVLIVAIFAIGYLVYQPKQKTDEPAENEKAASDQRNATYIIENKNIALKDGYAEEEITPGSVSKLITRYFGNEVSADFNGDGFSDIAFLLTRDTGGSGIFYYVAAVLNTEKGYQGTNAILLGDRIAPQSTDFRNGMIIVNYAERKPDEPMTAQSSVGVSKYFKVIDGALKAIELKMGEAEAETIAEKSCVKGGETLEEGTYNENSNTWWFDANLDTAREGCNPACVVSGETKTAEINWRCTGLKAPE